MPAADASYLSSPLPDPWAASRRTLLLGLFTVGLLGCVLALAVQWTDPDPLDRLALPILGSIFGVLFALLWTQRLSERTTAQMSYVAIAVYFLLSLNWQLFEYAPRTHQLSEATYWFPVLFATAFVAWRRRAALGWASGTFLVALISAVAHGPHLAAVAALNADLIGYLAQFFSASLASVLLLYHLTFLQERYAETRLLAYADFLTGLPNRRCGEYLLEQELRHQGPLTIVLFDLDHFKSVNDRHGHDVGDIVLRQAARVTSRRLRGEHQVVRWGGEEFLLIMPRTDARTAEHLAERIRSDIANHDFDGAGLLTASFGIAVQRPGDTPERLVKRADAALYRAKQLGRNRVKMPTMF